MCTVCSLVWKCLCDRASCLTDTCQIFVRVMWQNSGYDRTVGGLLFLFTMFCVCVQQLVTFVYQVEKRWQRTERTNPLLLLLLLCALIMKGIKLKTQNNINCVSILRDTTLILYQLA